MVPFVVLAAAFLSLWFRRPLFAIADFGEFPISSNRSLSPLFFVGSLLLALLFGSLSLLGVVAFCFWALLWYYYLNTPTLPLFFILIATSFLFKFHLLPGFNSYWFTPKFGLTFDAPLVGIIPLAFLIPLAHSKQDWIKVFKGLCLGCGGILLLAIAAIALGVVKPQSHIPPFATARYLSNLFLVAIPEEAFYRGFIQQRLSNILQKIKGEKILALIFSSLIFTLAHLYWAPSLDVFGFVFLAGLLYGTVYFIGGIESAILTHFLLNFIHMTFFSYHAL